MKRLACAVGVSLAAVILVPTAHAAGPPPAVSGDYVPDEVLVSFRAGVNVDDAAHAVGARVHRARTSRCARLKVRPGLVARTVAALSRNPEVPPRDRR
jgi:hypothetical protein